MYNNYSNIPGGPDYSVPGNYSFYSPVQNTVKKSNKLFFLSLCLGGGILLHLLLKKLYSFVLVNSRPLYNLYCEDDIFSILIQIFYSFVCVCLPFFLAYVIAKKLKLTNCTIPFSKPKSMLEVWFLLLAGIGICMGGNIVNSMLISFLTRNGVGFTSYDYAVAEAGSASYTPFTLLLTIIHTALFPAILEELAFRGFLMQPLRKYGDLYAVICSAVIFGIIHGNMTQAPFAICAGIVLGLLCVWTGSMWPNILLHFANNLISVLETCAVSASDTKTGYAVSYMILYGLIFIGISALISYFLIYKRIPQMKRAYPADKPLRWVKFFFAPTVILAVIIIFGQIINDIYLV